MPSFAEAILPPAVRRFLRDYPGVWIEIRDMDSGAVLRELEQEWVDIGFAIAAGTGAGSVKNLSHFVLGAGGLSPQALILCCLSKFIFI